MKELNKYTKYSMDGKLIEAYYKNSQGEWIRNDERVILENQLKKLQSKLDKMLQYSEEVVVR